MRVLFDYQIYLRQRVGGISRYFNNLVDVMRGCSEVELTSERFGPSGGVLGSIKKPVDGVVSFAVNTLGVNFGLLGRGDWDIHHATYHLSRLRRGKALVVTHHDCAIERFPHLFKYAKLHIKLKAEQLRRADKIITISDHATDDLCEYYDVDPARVTRIYHGVKALTGGMDLSLPKYLDSRPFLLYLGSRAHYKNFKILLHGFAASKINRDFVVVVGGGGRWSSAERELISDLKISDKVFLFPVLSDELLHCLYSRASVFVYPSLYEGFGFPPLEAMLAGCPVVASNSSSIPEICKDAALFFDPSSKESLIGVFDDICSDLSVLGRYRERGFGVASRYTWEQCVAETLKVYHAVLK